MYDELVHSLRICSKCDFGQNCWGCKQKTDDVFCCDKLLHEAADAIEELYLSGNNLVAVVDDMAEDLKKFRWIPVSERLPDIGKDVLCFCRAGFYFVLAWDGIHWHEDCDRYYMKSLVTHWMPLPEPPKDGE